MFDKLEDILLRFEEIMNQLSEPDVANDTGRFRKLMKEQSDLTPIVETYKEYKQAKQNAEDSLAMLEDESDEELRELAREELNDSKKKIEELEKKLKILLLPKDPNDDKNVIVEIRAGAGGDEAALFAAEIYRMYVRKIPGSGRRWIRLWTLMWSRLTPGSTAGSGERICYEMCKLRGRVGFPGHQMPLLRRQKSGRTCFL